jgi:hypothetical protein
VPAPGVVVAKVARVSFLLRVEALGTARANESIEIRSKVSETVTAIRFEEGQRGARRRSRELEGREPMPLAAAKPPPRLRVQARAANSSSDGLVSASGWSRSGPSATPTAPLWRPPSLASATPRPALRSRAA